MSLDVQVEVLATYLHVRVRGDNTPENLREYLKQVRDAAVEHGRSDVLIEEHLHGPPMDRFEIFRVVTDRTPDAALLNMRVAFVDAVERPDREGMELGESLANRRGVVVRSFEDLDAARRWITGGGA
ncbi:MAG: STAS/SEC14 domain-containing protein [Phycisphaeraceae bacterium]|nr:STAS/SEC14 domain-containing protein [Phycisphaeraceae bacterium]